MRYTLLFILCLVVLAVSCRRGESPPAHVGTWKLERVVSMKDAGQWTERFYLVFTKDGHLLRLPRREDIPEQSYRIETNGTLMATSPAGDFRPAGAVTVEGDTLTWRRTNGNYRVYQRIRTDPRQLDPNETLEQIQIEAPIK